MKSELGAELQRLIDEPGVRHSSNLTAWIQQTGEDGSSRVIGIAGSPVHDNEERRRQKRDAERRRRSVRRARRSGY